MKNPEKEIVTALEVLHSSVDAAYEEFVVAQAKFEAAKTKFARTLRGVKIDCGVTDDYGLDYSQGMWLPPKLQIPGQ